MKDVFYYFQKLRRIHLSILIKLVIKEFFEFLYHNIRAIYFSIKPLELSDDELMKKIKFEGSLENFIQHLDKRKSPKFFIDSNKELIKTLKKNYSENVRQTIKKANEILKHIFDLLGYKGKIGEKINWHKDFKVGKVWPKKYYKKIDFILLDEPCDIKVPWELSRFYHFVTLGKAYWYTKNEKYAKEFVTQLKDWIKENPMNFGINWISSMEASIRIVNWIWAYYFFKNSKYFDMETKKEFLKSLYFHANHILKNIEFSPIANSNHYISNGIGLLYLGILFPEFKDAKIWRDKGLCILLSSTKEQVLGDGVDYEKSVHYHRLVLDFFLHAFLLCKINNIKLPKWFETKLEKMMEFVAYYTKPNGLCPLIGDNDNGRLVFLEDSKNINDHRAHISTGAILFNRGDFKTSAKQLHEETLWLLGTNSLKKFKALKRKKLTSKSFKEGGYYIMRNNNSYLIIDCGDLGLKGMGGHGHNDTLSFELYANDKTFLTDSGCYVYTANYKERNHFRSTKAHNTIVVDGKEIAPFNEKDLWYIKDITKAKVNKWISIRNKDFFDGQHEGYKRIDNIIHRRQISFNKKSNKWIIRDIITGDGTHTCELYLHFSPMKLIRKDLNLETKTKGTNLIISPKNKENLKLIIKKDFVSESYGKKVKAPVAIYKKEGKLPLEFKTEIRVKR